MAFIPSVRNRYIIIFDLLLIIVSVLGAYAIRLDLVFYIMYTPSALWMIAVAVILKPMVYFLFGL